MYGFKYYLRARRQTKISEASSSHLKSHSTMSLCLLATSLRLEMSHWGVESCELGNMSSSCTRIPWARIKGNAKYRTAYCSHCLYPVFVFCRKAVSVCKIAVPTVVLKVPALALSVLSTRPIYQSNPVYAQTNFYLAQKWAKHIIVGYMC